MGGIEGEGLSRGEVSTKRRGLAAAMVHAARLGGLRSTHVRSSRKEGRRRVRTRVATDESVPEGHRELHGFLYRDGEEEEHGSEGYRLRPGVDDGSETVLVDDWLAEREMERPLGVFAIYDRDRKPQYVSYSRNVVVSVRSLRDHVGEAKCTYMRVSAFANTAMATRQNMERELENWLEDLGGVPPGNGEERDLWDVNDKGMKRMSEAEVQAYEDKKLKMRKAMGENLHDDVKGETIDAKERRLRLIKAVEGDNWSEVIGDQTEQALGQETVVSPFSNAMVHRELGKEQEEEEPMTVESVDGCLEEVRPYLIADGGNVEVVRVEDGRVYLRLQGACGTCASSTSTMKMGIERAIQGAFGKQLKEVVQLDSGNTSTSVAAIDGHLNTLRPAIHGLGGSVEVLSLENGICKIKYAGPEPIGMGVKAAVQDRFRDLKVVEFV